LSIWQQGSENSISGMNIGKEIGE